MTKDQQTKPTASHVTLTELRPSIGHTIHVKSGIDPSIRSGFAISAMLRATLTLSLVAE